MSEASCDHSARDWPAAQPVEEWQLEQYVGRPPRQLQWCRVCGAVRVLEGNVIGPWALAEVRGFDPPHPKTSPPRWASVDVGDVVQLVPDTEAGALGWGPLFAVVTEVKAWGCLASVYCAPEKRVAPFRTMPVRLQQGTYVRIGAAEWTVGATMSEIRNLYGHRMPVHVCTPRSAIAAAFATVYTQQSTDGTWHHQLDIGAAQPVAVRFCPFCGVELQRGHFK